MSIRIWSTTTFPANTCELQAHFFIHFLPIQSESEQSVRIRKKNNNKGLPPLYEVASKQIHRAQKKSDRRLPICLFNLVCFYFFFISNFCRGKLDLFFTSGFNFEMWKHSLCDSADICFETGIWSIWFRYQTKVQQNGKTKFIDVTIVDKQTNCIEILET